MKTSRLLVALGLGVAVLWAGAAPIATGVGSFTGAATGYYRGDDGKLHSFCPFCVGTDASGSDANCAGIYTDPGYPPEGEWLGCSGGDLTVCLLGGSGPKRCGLDTSAGPICNDNNGQGSHICNEIYDATCE